MVAGVADGINRLAQRPQQQAQQQAQHTVTVHQLDRWTVALPDHRGLKAPDEVQLPAPWPVHHIDQAVIQHCKPDILVLRRTHVGGVDQWRAVIVEVQVTTDSLDKLQQAAALKRQRYEPMCQAINTQWQLQSPVEFVPFICTHTGVPWVQSVAALRDALNTIAVCTRTSELLPLLRGVSLSICREIHKFFIGGEEQPDAAGV